MARHRILIGPVPPTPPLTEWILSVNFRETEPFVADGVGQTYCLNENYPTDRDGKRFGFSDGLGGDRVRDRDDTNDPRFAGGHFTNTTGSQDRILEWKADLPVAGTYKIRFALGDPSNGRTGQRAEVFDNITSKGSVSDASTASNQYVDASGVERTSPADWISNNVELEATFATTTFILKFGTLNAGSDNTFLTHIEIEYVPPADITTGTIAQSIGAPTQAVVAKQVEKCVVAQSIGAPVQSVVAKQVQSGVVAQSIGAPSQAVVTKQVQSGIVAQSISAPSQAVVAKQTQSAVVVQSIGAPSQSATATTPYTAAVAQSIGAPSQSATAKQIQNAVVAQSIGAPSQSATAIVPYVAIVASSISAPSQSIVAKQIQKAAVAQSIGAPSQSIEGTVEVEGLEAEVAQSISPASQSAQAKIVNKAIVAQSIGAPSQSATATVPNFNSVIAQTLSPASQSVVAKQKLSASSTQTIGPATQSVSAKQVVAASGSQSIGAPSQSIAAKIRNVAQIAGSIGACVNSIAAELKFSAIIAQTLSPATQSAIITIEVDMHEIRVDAPDSRNYASTPPIESLQLTQAADSRSENGKVSTSQSEYISVAGDRGFTKSPPNTH